MCTRNLLHKKSCIYDGNINTLYCCDSSLPFLIRIRSFFSEFLFFNLWERLCIVCGAFAGIKPCKVIATKVTNNMLKNSVKKKSLLSVTNFSKNFSLLLAPEDIFFFSSVLNDFTVRDDFNELLFHHSLRKKILMSQEKNQLAPW